MSTEVRMVGPANSPHVQAWVTAIERNGGAVRLVDVFRPGRRAWATVLILASENLRRRPSRSVVHSMGAYGAASLLMKTADRTLLVPWGSEVMRAKQSFVRRHIGARLLMRADLVVVTSDWMRQQIAGIWPFASDRIEVISWGVDTATFRPLAPPERFALRQRWGYTDTDVVIASTRGYKDLYQPAVIVDAFLNARKRNPALRLILTGTTSYTGVQHEYITRIAADDPDIRCLGWVDKATLADLYNIADVNVSIPTHDQRSTSVLEALASGLRSIVADLPAYNELLQDGAPVQVAPNPLKKSLPTVLASQQPRNEYQRRTDARWAQTHENEIIQMDRIYHLAIQ